MGEFDQSQLSAFSRMTLHYRVMVSRDLLDWIMMEGRIPDLFTNFITTPELSGPFELYIRPDLYHTQITEYLLAKIY